MNSTARFVWCLVALAAVGLVALALAAPPAAGRIAAVERAEVGEVGALDEAEPPAPDVSDEKNRTTRGTAGSPAKPTAAANSTDVARRDAAFAAALSVEGAEETLSIGLGALRRGPLGADLVACLRAAAPGDFRQAREKLGLDPVEAVERFGLAGELAVVSGRFAGARWAELTSSTPRGHGAHGVLYGPPEGEAETLGVWRDEILVVGPGPAAVMAALDRMEGRAAGGVSPAARRAQAARFTGGGEVRGRGQAAPLLEPLLLATAGAAEPADFGGRGLLLDALREAKLPADVRLDVVDGGLQVSLSVRSPEDRTPDTDDLEAVLESVAQGMRGGVDALKSASAEGAYPVPEPLAGVLKRTRISHRDGEGLRIDLDVPAADLKALLAMCGGERALD